MTTIPALFCDPFEILSKNTISRRTIEADFVQVTLDRYTIVALCDREYIEVINTKSSARGSSLGATSRAAPVRSVEAGSLTASAALFCWCASFCPEGKTQCCDVGSCAARCWKPCVGRKASSSANTINACTTRQPASAFLEVAEPAFFELDLMWDTGCQRRAISAKNVPTHAVLENELSRSKSTFSAADDSSMPCAGECTFVFTDDGNHTGSTVMNVTTVNRPFWSVGTILDNHPEEDCFAVFTKHEGEIRSPSRPILVVSHKQPGGFVSQESQSEKP